MSRLFDQFNRRLGEVRDLRDAERRDPDVGANIASSVADVHILPPADWETALRAVNPISRDHSYLRFYYYRLKDRWVLYDCMPVELVDPDKPIQPGFMGWELLAALRGPAPRDLSADLRTPFVSDAQHEMHRLERVYAVPFWVLEGSTGGHQVAYSPIQRQHLTEMNQSITPPVIGSLPGCAFDARVVTQLNRMNRLAKMGGNLDRLRNSGSPDAWAAEMDEADKEIRRISLEMLEQQLGETVEMVQTYGGRKDTADSVIHRPGEAARASEALAAYIETGDFIM